MTDLGNVEDVDGAPVGPSSRRQAMPLWLVIVWRKKDNELAIAWRKENELANCLEDRTRLIGGKNKISWQFPGENKIRKLSGAKWTQQAIGTVTKVTGA